MRGRRRHCPLLDGSFACASCGEDALSPIHWPPVGWRENLLELFGLLREWE